MMEIDLSVLAANTLVQFFSGWLGRYRGRYILYLAETVRGGCGNVPVVALDLLLTLVVALLLIVALLLLAVARRVDGDHWRWWVTPVICKVICSSYRGNEFVKDIESKLSVLYYIYYNYRFKSTV